MRARLFAAPAALEFALVRALERRERPEPMLDLRKTCFGNQSDGGARFVERMLSVALTCKLQSRSLFAYLTHTLEAVARGDPAPRSYRHSAPAAGDVNAYVERQKASVSAS